MAALKILWGRREGPFLEGPQEGTRAEVRSGRLRAIRARPSDAAEAPVARRTGAPCAPLLRLLHTCLLLRLLLLFVLLFVSLPFLT